LINQADIKSAGGVAPRVRTHGSCLVRTVRLEFCAGVRGILTEAERRALYESYSTRTIIRAASRISDHAEIVVGSQAIHA